MSTGLKATFLVHAVVGVVAGLLLFLIPGRFLGVVGWGPIDPIASRLLGAAMLALAWSSLRGWRASEWAEVAILVELEVVFTVLACVGLLRHLLFGWWPWVPWFVLALYALFAVAWIVFFVQGRAAEKR